ncbi:MAG: hypothetical protein Q9216_006787, partial [Gyalolechia sp. 2 TL-2023]
QANPEGLNRPANFKVEVVPKVNIPIDPEELYRTAVDMMFVVSDHALTQTWLERTFSSPIGPAGIYVTQTATGKDPSRLNTQHIIWGLNHVMLAVTLSKKYCQTTATIKLDGFAIGAIEIVPRRRRIALQETGDENEPLQNVNFGQGLSHYFDREVTIQVAYGQRVIDRKLIYLTGIKAMGDAAEKGLDTPCEGMLSIGIQQVTWNLVREGGSHVPIFKAGHSRVAAFSTLGKLVHDNRFQAINTFMKIEGDLTAVGGFHQGLRAATA